MQCIVLLLHCVLPLDNTSQIKWTGFERWEGPWRRRRKCPIVGNPTEKLGEILETWPRWNPNWTIEIFLEIWPRWNPNWKIENILETWLESNWIKSFRRKKSPNGEILTMYAEKLLCLEWPIVANCENLTEMILKIIFLVRRTRTLLFWNLSKHIYCSVLLLLYIVENFLKNWTFQILPTESYGGPCKFLTNDFSF